MKESLEIRIKEYNYSLPDERIAKFPLPQRDHSRLLVYQGGIPKEDRFYNIAQHIPSGSLMVFNNTKVIQARMYFNKESGAQIEIFCLEPIEPKDYALSFAQNEKCCWVCMVGNLKKWKEGELTKEIQFQGETITLKAEKKGTIGNYLSIEFSWDKPISFAEIMDIAGELPIPPYLNRKTEESDKITYQTVYSKIKGSVAAPTAGLHFTEEVFQSLKDKGITRKELTLHVGAGTFKPVKSETIKDHEMHIESFCVDKQLIEALIHSIGKIVAVGTTSVRTLESLYYIGLKIAENPSVSEEDLQVMQWEPYENLKEISVKESLTFILHFMEKHQLERLHTATQIIIVPGYQFKLVSIMVTNFHQPCSTLLLLVSAFVNGDWRNIYDFALSHDFRFLSYGDSSILFPNK